MGDDGLDDVGRAFQCLTQVGWTRQTSVAQLRTALLTRRGLRHRALLLELLTDLEAGACSVLEREYLRRVEQPHGLPEGQRQVRADSDGRPVYRDVTLAEWGTLIELDGLAFHGSPLSRDRDSTRDLVAAVAHAEREVQTVRLTYRQVLDDGCRTARLLGELLARRGWTGSLRRCPRCPGDLGS